MSTEITVEKSWIFPALPGVVWPLISHTDHVSRMMDLSSLRFVKAPVPDAGHLLRVTGNVGGIDVEYDESPFQWVENRYYVVERTYRKGWVRRLHLHVTVEAHPEGTLVRLLARVHPWKGLRKVFGKPFSRGVLNAYSTGYERLIRGLRDTPSDPVSGGRPQDPSDGVDLAQVESLRQAFGDMPQWRGIVDSLARRISHGYDFEVDRMEAFELADRWGVDRRDVLRVFLRATHRGYLMMSWNHLCGSCRGPAEQEAQLSTLTASAMCTSCEIETEADFARTISLVFSPAPALRALEPAFYCKGGPGGRKHIVAQQLLSKASVATLELDLPPGEYRLHVGPIKVSAFAGHVATLVVRDGIARSEATCAVTEAGFDVERLDLSPGKQVLSIQSDDERLLQIERVAWGDQRVTGAIVATCQDFRDLFPDQVLASGVELRVDPVTILFTDLKSSTAMYERLGDDEAFALVRDHFAILLAEIDRHQGAVVKTVGDAVMAVFQEPDQAVKAALDLQAGIARYNRDHPGRERLIVKPGVHAGPALAVRLNDRLDYFGTTVNLAARVQNEAHGQDLVLSQAMMSYPNVQALIEGLHGAHRETREVRLKGLQGAYPLTFVSLEDDLLFTRAASIAADSDLVGSRT